MTTTPPDVERLRRKLLSIDGRGYPAYKDIRADYDFGPFTLIIDHVQGDPFADPSRMRARMALDVAAIPADLLGSHSRRRGLRHFIAAGFAEECRKISRSRGSGKSGEFAFVSPGQEVLEQTGILIDDAFVEARFRVALPADGRRVKGKVAAAMLCDELPALIEKALTFANLDGERAKRAALTNEDADALRGLLPGLGLIAFVADGAVLPRRTGVDQRPLERGAVPFSSPESLRVEVELPNSGKVSGMGIPAGVTLIVGGGFHGKSTLLAALERGVYNHRPGDGRELAVTTPDAVKVRAEDARSISGVDISPFINNLPQGQDTSRFTTANASGSTSQAANISEALEAGTGALLIDEDTSATNFMIRDHRMQELIVKEREPITPFVDVVHRLHRERGVSTVLVMGGSGDYFDVADRVIALEEYRVEEVTDEAARVAARHETRRVSESLHPTDALTVRRPLGASMNPRKGRREESFRAFGTRAINFGVEEIDLSAAAQLVHPSQTRAIGLALLELRRRADGKTSMAELLDAAERLVAERGLDALSDRVVGDLAGFRRFELAAALNRLRTLEVSND